MATMDEPRVELMNADWSLTGESLNLFDARKYIACLEARVKDLENEFNRLNIDPDNSRRADQNCVCPSCKKKYRDHPYGGPIGYDKEMFLHRLCDGDLVKL